MTNHHLLQAMGSIDPKLIADAAPDAAKPKKAGRTWMKWGAVAAAGLALVFAVVISAEINSFSAAEVWNYGPFIFMPILVAVLLSFCLSFTKIGNTRSSLLLTNALLLVAINILNVLGVCLYSECTGINIIFKLPIILTSSNVGLCLSLGTCIAIIQAKRSWWQRLILYLLLLVVSVVVSCLAHYAVSLLARGDAFITL